ncbi:hypothetical protein [uncultured Brevundimonas sp.]|uniref:hypothetical protein n=1 Tax=uncultured Brevundimonas sp. TaxID=213418 RepID=UPI002634CCA4|nr:hypothetical protein [uncultured Brevundimonas sp.]
MSLRVFAVRVAETHEPVGIFVARNAADLPQLVDEFCPTQGMEFLEMGAGGIFVKATDVQWPDLREPEEMEDTPWSHVSERWALPLTQNDGWKPMEPL